MAQEHQSRKADAALIEEYALVVALPYVETAEHDEIYKKGAVAKVVKQMRHAIALAEGAAQ